MKRSAAIFVCLALAGIFSTPVLAVEVEEALVTAGIVDRMPAEVLESYPVTVEKLYCFTRITGAVGETSVIHVWYHEEEEMARVELPVRSPDWRTWSSKTILPSWTGDWKVEILDSEENLLATVPFSLF